MKVTVTMYNPNYVPFTEHFDSLAAASREMERRLSDRYYPLWEDTEALARPQSIGGCAILDTTHEGKFTRNGYWRWVAIY